MLQIPSTRMEPVQAAYAKEHKKPKMDDKAQWNLDGKFDFLETPASAELLGYYMINGSDLSDTNVSNKYGQSINATISQYGIAKGAICRGMTTLPSYHIKFEEDENNRSLPKTHEELKEDIKEAIEQCKQQSADGKLVVLVLEKHNIPVYSAFKDIADRVAGLQSLCVTAEKNSNKQIGNKGLSQYFANVMMKVNLKQGGRNHTVCDETPGEGTIRHSLFNNPPARSVMVLGSDVTHPGSSSLIGCPSIAALVGSVDLDGGKFLGSMRLQEKSKKEVSAPDCFERRHANRYKMIDDIEGMAKDRFRAWRGTQRAAPNVLYYRDGVSTG
jgi:eukaryotic translation initiation factor 2C